MTSKLGIIQIRKVFSLLNTNYSAISSSSSTTSSATYSSSLSPRSKAPAGSPMSHVWERNKSQDRSEQNKYIIAEKALNVTFPLSLSLSLSLPTCWSCQLSPSFWSIVGKVTCVYDRSAVLWWLWNQKSLSDWVTQWQAKKSNQSLKCI